MVIILKNAVISSIILLVIIGLLTANSIILGNLTDELLSDVDSMSDIPSLEYESAVKLFEKWSKYEKFASLTVHQSKTDNVTNAAAMILAYSRADSSDEFAAAKSSFALAVMNVRFSLILTSGTVL